MKRYKKCPICDNSDKETFMFCAVGHSLCCKCGFGDSIEECKSKEDRIKRFFECIKWTIEYGDFGYIFDVSFFVRKTIDKINKTKL